MDYIYYYNSPLGGITLASDGKALKGLWFNGQKFFADTLSEKYTNELLPIFSQTIKWLDIYFSGKEPDFTPSLTISSTPFREAVWKILLTIPYGSTVTYGQIAKIMAVQNNIRKMSAQAVGSAVAHNPISLIIPCHRVIGSGKKMTGYAGGIDKKIKLLALENANITNNK